MKTDGSLKSLLQGVSQQPPRDRLAGQCTEQWNFLSDPVQGLTRRPPTDLVGLLGEGIDVKGWHTFSARDGSRYLAWFKDDDIRVFDLNANSIPVDVPIATRTYLNYPGAIKAATDEKDTTTIINQFITPEMLTDIPAYFNQNGLYAGMIQILGGAYGRTYQVFSNGGLVGTHTTPDGSVAAHSAQIDTGYIADKLTVSLGSMLGGGYSLMRKEDVILVYSSGAFKLTASDGSGNINIKCMNDTVTDVADLPRIAPHLYTVRVAEKTDSEKDLWFKFLVESSGSSLTPSASAFGEAGFWQECVAPNTAYKFKLDTMPHVLYKNEALGIFELRQGPWVERAVGTEVSNPRPSFIGNPIKDVSSFQGRGVFVAGSNVCMSRTNKPFDYWFGSASALADTDPIDINSTVEASGMVSVVPHNRDLVVFSNEAQFVVFGRTKITPENASLVLTTQFESEVNAHPVGAGKNIFFASNYGRYTAVREFFAEGNSDINDSRPITQHIKRYITGKARHLAASSNYDMLAVHTEGDDTGVYVYQYIWSDSEKVQAAWHKWIFEWPIVYSFFDEDRLYLVQRVQNEYYLLRMPLDVQDSDGLNYPIALDNRFDVFGAGIAFTTPYKHLATGSFFCVQGEGCPRPGLPAPIALIAYDAGLDAVVVTLKSSVGAGNIVAGNRFLSRYKPTMPMVRDKDGVVVTTGNLRLRQFMVSLYESGEIIGLATSSYGNGPEVKFNARVVGAVDNFVGEQPLSNDTFNMPFRQDTDQAEVEFYTRSHLPLTILDIEWVGQYSKRGNRIGNGGK